MLRAFHIAIVVLAWIGLAYKVSGLRRRSDPARVALCLALLFFTLAFTVGLPPLYQRIPWFAEDPSLVRLVQHGLIVLAVFWTHLMTVHLETTAKAWPRTVIMAVFLTAMIVLFILASPGDAAEDFVQAYATWPFVTEYLLTFLGFLTISLADICRLSLRFAGRARERPLQIGLRLWSAASLMGFAYALHKAIYALAVRLGVQPSWLEGPVSTTLSGLVLALFIAGLTTYSWGPRISAARRWWRHYRTYRALLPLWRAFYNVMPDLALIPATEHRMSIRAWRTVELRLYRCVIEILDGRLALRAYWDNEVVQSARTQAMTAGLKGLDLDAATEAAALNAALAAKKRNETTGHEPPTIPDAEEAGMAGEIRRLVRVARAYRRIRACRREPAALRACAHV